MALAALTTRARAVWENLAGVPVAFAPVLRVTVSPRSGLCPPGWAGPVVIAGAALATAPDRRSAQVMLEALGTIPAALVTDAGLLSGGPDIAEMLGPATLAYLDPADFRPRSGPAAVELLDACDPAFRRFVSEAETGDLTESGISEITSPAFVIREHAQVITAAGYRDWRGQVAHLSVLTALHARGRGLGGAAASAAHAAGENKLPQWRARPQASRRIARRLGFRELGSQVSIRLGSKAPGGQ